MRLARQIAMALGTCTLISLGAVGVAQAASTKSVPVTYHFTACAGPAGTPTTFDAEKHPTSSPALRLTSGTGVFVIVQAIDASSKTILFATAGFAHNDVSTITCSVTQPVTGREEIVTGFITPAGAG